MTLGEYVTTLYPTRDALLQELPGKAEREGLPAIHIPDEVGRLLQVLIISSGVRTVLELGTLFGYSTIWMARALPGDGRIISLEAVEKHAAISKRNLEAAGLAAKVDVRVGPAIESLPRLSGQTFDLVFIDADKPGYVAYLEWALQLTHAGSLIVADNTWRHGDVVAATNDEGNRIMAEFNRLVAANEGLVSTVIATRDGGDAVTVATVRGA
jgi:predicted O-methyltransferase YrrM